MAEQNHEDQQENYERTIFYNGMFTIADDWNLAHDYHITKLKQHNTLLHTPGIISGVDGDLAVSFVKFENEVFVFKVSPGAAIDPEGNMIRLLKDEQVLIPKKGLYGVRYIGIRFMEKPRNISSYNTRHDANGNAQGGANRDAEALNYSRKVETPELFFDTIDPDQYEDQGIELARINFSADATTILAPEPNTSDLNRIDRDGVRWSKSATALDTAITAEVEARTNKINELETKITKLESTLNDVATRVGIAESEGKEIDSEEIYLTMNEMRDAFAKLDEHFPVPSNSDVRNLALTIVSLAKLRLLSKGQLKTLFEKIWQLQVAVYMQLGDNHTYWLEGTPAFDDYNKYVGELNQKLGSSEFVISEVTHLLREVTRAVRAMADISTRPQALFKMTQTEISGGENDLVTLDASPSRAQGNKTIKHYQWKLISRELI